MSWTRESLIAAARDAATRAYAPYSNFHVGAALGFADGSISMWKDVSERTATAISGQPN